MVTQEGLKKREVKREFIHCLGNKISEKVAPDRVKWKTFREVFIQEMGYWNIISQ